MKILCGDIGGTNTRLALLEVGENPFVVYEESSFLSQKYESLYDIVNIFLTSKKISCERACFGLAGPVSDDRCKITNLPWWVDAKQLAQDIGIDKVLLINDLVANAYGIRTLAQSDFLVLNEGNPNAVGNAVVVSAGTALGEAGLYWDGKQHVPFASEGGHADFSPDNESDLDLITYLFKRFGRVSWEQILSGSGMVNIYQFLCEQKKMKMPSWLEVEMRTTDAASCISSAGIARKCPICIETLDIFVRLYGAEAGNYALKILATGGVYLGGGIAPKIVERLKMPNFMNAFLNKSKMEETLREISVKVILNERTALFGAAYYAMVDRDE